MDAGDGSVSVGIEFMDGSSRCVNHDLGQDMKTVETFDPNEEKRYWSVWDNEKDKEIWQEEQR